MFCLDVVSIKSLDLYMFLKSVLTVKKSWSRLKNLDQLSINKISWQISINIEKSQLVLTISTKILTWTSLDYKNLNQDTKLGINTQEKLTLPKNCSWCVKKSWAWLLSTVETPRLRIIHLTLKAALTFPLENTNWTEEGVFQFLYFIVFLCFK